jgi:hypothetical protein
VTAPDPLRGLLDRTVAEAVDGLVARAVGDAVPREGESGRFRVTHVGSFSRRGVANLIRWASNPEMQGAIVCVDGDVVRALYARDGRLVGAESNVLFERLGRVLEKAGRIDREARRAAVAAEEAQGTAAAVGRLLPEVARFGVERRLREVAETLFLVKRGTFVVVEGRPSLGAVPEASLDPDEVAAEGIARYEAWRAAGTEAASPPPSEGASAPPARARPDETQDVTLEALDLSPPSPPRGSTTTTADLTPIRDLDVEP